uniref:Glycosyltransferase 2-like domain-containing protein n=1 Tax=viral metagenome TaxID=1070528 RepID=A0A6C0EV73_9ZZZZ
MNCCICGPVKNCGPYLNKVFKNIEKIGSIFDDYEIIIYYDKSSDNTLQILKEYQNKNSRMKFYVNTTPTSPYRTHNIAKARNFCLNYVKENKDTFPYFIMMDFDDVNCKDVTPEIIKKYLEREDWDGLSFNTSPKYYDIWGLSIYPFCFSYNHFNNNVQYYTVIQDYVTNLLNKLPNDTLLKCISSFNGFSIYRTSYFLNTYYDGRIRMDLISKVNLNAHKQATKSKLVFKKYITVDGRYEDCEHRAFHIQASNNSQAKIMISPEVLFS